MGPLAGIRVIELSHEAAAWAGKLLADLGADVIVVEPPGGSRQRTYGPFVDDVRGPETSLWWWHYNTSKRSVVLDLERDRSQLETLLTRADVLLEAEVPGRLDALGLGWEAVSAHHPGLVMVSITPFGQRTTRSHEPAVDLTVLAEGGPVWSCGYDDHELPPVRGGGNQGFQTACHWAVMSLLVALLHREEHGTGQHIDVSMHAAANVTTEMATYGWMACGAEVQRQTGRHASPVPTQPTQIRCKDGRYVTTGLPARTPAEFRNVLSLLARLGLRDEFGLAPLLEMGSERESISIAQVELDPLVAEIFGAAREVLWYLAENMTAYEFFIATQDIGLATGIVYAPEEMMQDPHFVARGFVTDITHDDHARSFTYPGAPYRFSATPWSATRAPHVGEHQHLLD